jgi:hypothetical protein
MAFGCLAAVPALLIAGCSRNPNVEISGSFFPAWMICCGLAAALTLVIRQFFIRYNIHRHLNPPLLVYTCLMLGLTILIWFILFF